jgi:hypothetical protein
MSFAGTARSEKFVHLELSCVVLISLREDFRWAGCMFPFFYLQNESFIAIKVRPEENDGANLFSAMNNLEDASHVVPLLGTLEGP